MVALPEQINPEEAKREKIKSPEKIKKTEEKIETAEGLRQLGDKTEKQVQESSKQAIKEGDQTIEGAVNTAGGGPKDIEIGKAATSEVQKEMSMLAHNTQKNIREVSAGEKHEAVAEKLLSIRDEYTPEQLAELREKTKVDYGEGLVSKYHKGADTVADHEVAQREAYKALDKKIEAGAVKPDSIGSDILSRLELRNKPETHIDSMDQIASQVSLELKELTEKGFIAKEEAALIEMEGEKYTKHYIEAFSEASPQQVYEIVRDNTRKLAYQTERDKQVFSGSDHGTRHILEGNMINADKMIESLGDRVSAKDKVLIHQIIIDHDLGYTVGIAQAKESFAASKDHPLFSTKFVEANQKYYKQKFGEDGYKMILEGVLQHSYPKSEYGTPTDPKKGFNPDMIRSITSTVDALGVTAETKSPAFFRSPEVITVLQKVELFAETHQGKVSTEALAMYKKQLRKIADQELNAVRREGFYNAIDKQFNPVTVEMTLGLYVGVLKDIKMVERKGKIIPKVNMDISRVQALLGDLFGDKVATKAFMKAMGDFGVSRESMSDMAEAIRQINKEANAEEKKRLLEKLTFSSDKAIFEFGTEFDDNTPEIAKTFEEFERVTIRDETRTLTRDLESLKERTPKNVGALLSKFNTMIGEEVDETDLKKIMEIQGLLRNNIENPNEFANALNELINLTTKKEREFMGI